jgi:hypothetical protein
MRPMRLALIHIASHAWIIAIFALGIYAAIFLALFSVNRGPYYYFDNQDFLKYEGGGGRKLPHSAHNGTFEPMLKHYIGLAQLVITVAAASIAFGGTQAMRPAIASAKLLLAFCIVYGVSFCAAILYRYDEYNHNVECYTRFWYATVEGLGFTTLVCFMFGYVLWALAWL